MRDVKAVSRINRTVWNVGIRTSRITRKRLHYSRCTCLAKQLSAVTLIESTTGRLQPRCRVLETIWIASTYPIVIIQSCFSPIINESFRSTAAFLQVSFSTGMRTVLTGQRISGTSACYKSSRDHA